MNEAIVSGHAYIQAKYACPSKAFILLRISPSWRWDQRAYPVSL